MGTQDHCPALQLWSRAEPNQLSEGSRALTGMLGTAGQGRRKIWHCGLGRRVSEHPCGKRGVWLKSLESEGHSEMAQA